MHSMHSPYTEWLPVLVVVAVVMVVVAIFDKRWNNVLTKTSPSFHVELTSDTMQHRLMNMIN